MTDHAPTPKLIVGHIVCFSLNDEAGTIPPDEAVIHLEDDEDSEIEIKCPDAARLASVIVRAVNSHDALVKALQRIAGNEFLCPRAAEFAQGILADVGGSGNG